MKQRKLTPEQKKRYKGWENADIQRDINKRHLLRRITGSDDISADMDPFTDDITYPDDRTSPDYAKALKNISKKRNARSDRQSVVPRYADLLKISKQGTYHPFITESIVRQLRRTGKTLNIPSESERNLVYDVKSKAKRADAKKNIALANEELDKLKGLAESGRNYPFMAREAQERLAKAQKRLAKYPRRNVPAPIPEPIPAPIPEPRRAKRAPDVVPVREALNIFPRATDRIVADRATPTSSPLSPKVGRYNRPQPKDFVRRHREIGPKNLAEELRVPAYDTVAKKAPIGGVLRDEAGNMILGGLDNDNTEILKRKKRGTLAPGTEGYIQEEAGYARAKRELAQVRAHLGSLKTKHEKEVAGGAGGGFSPLYQGRLAEAQKRELAPYLAEEQTLRHSRQISRKRLGIRSKALRNMSPEMKAQYNWRKSKAGKAARNAGVDPNVGVNSNVKETKLGKGIYNQNYRPIPTHEEEMAGYEERERKFNKREDKKISAWEERKRAHDEEQRAVREGYRKRLAEFLDNRKAKSDWEKQREAWDQQQGKVVSDWEARKAEADKARADYKATKNKWRRDTLQYNVDKGNLMDVQNWRRKDYLPADTPYGGGKGQANAKETRIKTADLDLIRNNPKLWALVKKSRRELTPQEEARGYSGYVFHDFNPEANRQGMFDTFGHWDETTLPKVKKFNEPAPERKPFGVPEPQPGEFKESEPSYAPFGEAQPERGTFGEEAPLGYEAKLRKSFAERGGQVKRDVSTEAMLPEDAVEDPFTRRDRLQKEKILEEVQREARKKQDLEGFQRKSAQRGFAIERNKRQQEDNLGRLRRETMANFKKKPLTLATKKAEGGIIAQMRKTNPSFTPYAQGSKVQSTAKGIGDWLTGSGRKTLADKVAQSNERERLKTDLLNRGVPLTDSQWLKTKDKRAEKGLTANMALRGLQEGAVGTRLAQSLLRPHDNTSGTRSGQAYNQATRSAGRLTDSAVDSLGGLAQNSIWGLTRKYGGSAVAGLIGGGLGTLGVGALGALGKWAYGKYREGQQRNTDIREQEGRDYAEAEAKMNSAYDYGLSPGKPPYRDPRGE
jgi:hypothetical protein